MYTFKIKILILKLGVVTLKIMSEFLKEYFYNQVIKISN